MVLAGMPNVGRRPRLDESDRRSLVRWAADCAEHVLLFFEERHPEDGRPRTAVEAGRAWARGELAIAEVRAAASAAHAAARTAADAASHAAARAAGHAAAAAHVVGHAAHAATYAATAAAVAVEDAPGSSVDAPDAATARECAWQLQQLPEHLRPVIFPAPP
jgi:hypothetical protein